MKVQVINKKILKNIRYFSVLKTTEEKSRICKVYDSVIQWYGCADPGPYQKFQIRNTSNSKKFVKVKTILWNKLMYLHFKHHRNVMKHFAANTGTLKC
jgi:hypothetical protein